MSEVPLYVDLAERSALTHAPLESPHAFATFGGIWALRTLRTFVGARV